MMMHGLANPKKKGITFSGNAGNFLNERNFLPTSS